MAIDPAKTGGQLTIAADDPTLAEIARRLVETYRPERVFARGPARRARPPPGPGHGE